MLRYKESHDLMPDSIVETIPRLNATDGDPDRTMLLKWFTPDSSWSWYVIEYDPAERLCFGLVDGLGQELTYFSLDQIEHLRGPHGLPVERDPDFSPTPLSDLFPEMALGR